MNLFDWLNGRFTNRSKAMWLYRRGMAKAKLHNRNGAIRDYTRAIQSPQAPPDVIAMALYNRALAQVASDEDQKGIEDLDAVLAMDGAPVNVKSMAREKRARVESRAGKA